MAAAAAAAHLARGELAAASQGLGARAGGRVEMEGRVG